MKLVSYHPPGSSTGDASFSLGFLFKLGWFRTQPLQENGSSKLCTGDVSDKVNLSGCQSISQGYSHLSLITWKYGSRCWFLVIYPWQISLFSKKCSLDMMYLYTLAYMQKHSIYIHNILYDTLYTPRKINMEPENRPLEKENHLPNHHFQVPC